MNTSPNHTVNSGQFRIEYVPISSLKASEYNPRKISQEAMEQLKESIRKFEVVDPIVVNSADSRKNIIIGGHQRYRAVKELGHKTIPTVYVNIPDIEKERELNLRLNKNVGEWNWDLLTDFDEKFLSGLGFGSEELDKVFGVDETPEIFDLEKELRKLNIEKIETKPGDIYQIGPDFKLMNGDSTVEADVIKLMNGEKADMCFTDEPYVLDYTKGKKRSKKNEGFGYKRDRKYLGTDTLPPDFMAQWLANIHKIQKEDFSIISFENWKNLKQMWEEMEKY